MLNSHRCVLNTSPSSISNWRRMTLSRVVMLPEKSMRRTKNCLPSSKVSVRSILSVFGKRLKARLGHEIDIAELAVEFLQIREALAQLGGGKHVALLHPEHRFA